MRRNSARRKRNISDLRTYRKAAFVSTLFTLMLFAPWTRGTPPEYKSFRRPQRVSYAPDPDRLLRIWMVHVGQGDGLLIQLPPKCNYDPNLSDDVSTQTETVDIMIDGGSHEEKNATLMEKFLLKLYEAPVVIEHAVITHHDSDHVKGLIHILKNTSVDVESIYHNGLASYRSGKRGFSDSTTADEAVRHIEKGQLIKGMAFLETDDDGQGKKLREADLIGSMNDLRTRLNDDEFEGVYDELARAVVEKEQPVKVGAFQRCTSSGSFNSFIAEREADLDRGVNLKGIKFEIIWPLPRARKYGSWSETINGNSVTFRLDYGDFSMLFTGDHNEKSEKKLLEHLGKKQNVLDVDVMKVPHHGSRHAYERFFRRKKTASGYLRPVLSVASMGTRGFTTSWKHPSTEVIKWLGGAHRVYHTGIHERTFRWDDLNTREARKRMQELKHILIETDGKWFRLAEVDPKKMRLPTVPMTQRSDGTRWIRCN